MSGGDGQTKFVQLVRTDHFTRAAICFPTTFTGSVGSLRLSSPLAPSRSAKVPIRHDCASPVGGSSGARNSRGLRLRTFVQHLGP